MNRASTTDKPAPGEATAYRKSLIICTLRVAMLAATAALLSGCIILLDEGSSGSSMGSGANMGGEPSPGTSIPPADRLPAPDVWRIEPPVLDAEAQKRLEEVEQFVAAQYQAAGWQILGTTQSFLGDLYDWIDPNTVEGSQEEPPPPPTVEEMHLPEGVQLQLTELDAFPELRGPENTIPVLRPSFWVYVLGLSGATSLEDFLNTVVAPGAPSTPYDPNRLYAGMISRVENQGASVSINAYAAPIEPFTMSVLEMIVGCRNAQDEMWQYIGIAASRDYATSGFPNFFDWQLRLQVEFFSAGSGVVGQGKGGWAGTRSVTDFVPRDGAPYGPGTAFAPQTVSTVGGVQYESIYHIRRFAGSNGDINWWVGHNGHWLGYYPGRLFGDGAMNLLASNACEVHWYGEVYDDPVKSMPDWTWTDMGSGQFASEGWGKAAYFRNPVYFDAAGNTSWPPSDPTLTFDIPQNLYNPNCYTKTELFSGAAPWNLFFYASGPGNEFYEACNGPIPPQP